jgi:glycerophosphoryl diester phosphodiesterase
MFVTQVIAHRGASAAARENTTAAFRLAVELGADAIELDVRRTLDDHLVVHHDPRLADGRPLVELRRSELPSYVPALADALTACAGAWVNIEIKNDAAEPDHDPDDRVASMTVDLLATLPASSRWLISSFRLATIDRVRMLTPGIATAWLVDAVPDDAVDVLVARGHRALHPSVRRLELPTVRACHAAGIAVNTWTCDEPSRMAELMAWGVDGICTNVPDVALAVRRRASDPAVNRPPGTPA